MSDSSDLAIEAIYDLRFSQQAEPVQTERYLSTLSEAEWSELRALATKSQKKNQPILICGDCKSPVYARESIKGRRHCYHFSGDHSKCRWASAVAGNIRSIDAKKFQGQQEGEEHKFLSRLVEEVIRLNKSTRTANIALNRFTKADNGEYAYPDVFAEDWMGSPAAFEIQLATTQIPVIARREEFYQQAGIRLIWIVGYHKENILRRSFRDIYMRNDGQILGMDGEVASLARESGEPMFRLYRLLPGSATDGFKPQWKDKIVNSREINWGTAGDRPRSARLSYDDYLNKLIEKDARLRKIRVTFYEALKSADEDTARKAWDNAVTIVGGKNWESMPSSYDTVRAFGVLATLQTGELYVPTSISIDKKVSLVNSMLLEPRERRRWTHAFKLLCQSKGLSELLAADSVQSKCQRNLSEEITRTPDDIAVGPVFDLFFPAGAFFRISFDEY